MDTTFTYEYKKWIEGLSELNFKELIRNYAKEYYDSREVNIIDGPYDGGIDLEYKKDEIIIKRNIQITIQEKGYEKKLENDLKSAKENVDKYNYLNTLDFYYKYSISPEKKKALIRNAEVKYQITLRIIDANELAGLAREFKSIRDTIHNILEEAFPKQKLNIDDKTKVLFDTISMGQDATQVKHLIVQSIILSFIYEKSSASVDEIFTGLSETFFKKYDRHFFEQEISKLKIADKIIDIQGTKPKQFKLTESTYNWLHEITLNAELLERQLVSSINTVLARYNLDKETEKVANYLIELYNSNYEIDEAELLRCGNHHQKKIQQIFSSLLNYLQRQNGINEKTATDITRQLLVVCETNEFLNKTSISKMFTNLFKSDQLETYLSSARRVVYLDTQILLQAICCNYEPIDYDDPLYKAGSCFFETIRNSSIPISLHTTNGYVTEVVWHLIDGLKLERFLELDFIKDLGPSKNVFFNYYLEVREANDLKSFSDFIESLCDVNPLGYSDHKILAESIGRNLVPRFNYLGINIETPPYFDNWEKYKREYEIALSYLKHDQKSYEARKNDLTTILHLSELHFDFESGYFDEPFLITWDSSFYDVRNRFRKFSELNHWYIYPPMKFANTIAVLNMKIDSVAINHNIISMVEENFNSSNDTISFLDLVNELVNSKDVTNWKLVNKLAKLRKRLVEDSGIEDFSRVKSKSIPIDEMLLLIQRFYQNPENKRKYEDLVSLFQNNDYAERISIFIERNLTDFVEKQKLKNHIVEEFDRLIAESNPNAPKV